MKLEGARALSLSPRFLNRAVRGVPLVVPGNGSQPVCVTHVEDVADQLASVIGARARRRTVSLALSPRAHAPPFHPRPRPVPRPQARRASRGTTASTAAPTSS